MEEGSGLVILGKEQVAWGSAALVAAGGRERGL